MKPISEEDARELAKALTICYKHNHDTGQDILDYDAMKDELILRWKEKGYIRYGEYFLYKHGKDKE